MTKKTLSQLGAIAFGLIAIAGIAMIFTAPKPDNGEDWIKKKYSATVIYDEKPKTAPKLDGGREGDISPALPADQRRLRELFPELKDPAPASKSTASQ